MSRILIIFLSIVNVLAAILVGLSVFIFTTHHFEMVEQLLYYVGWDVDYGTAGQILIGALLGFIAATLFCGPLAAILEIERHISRVPDNLHQIAGNLDQMSSNLRHLYDIIREDMVRRINSAP
jgi:hypothetical protein